jgi:hypothetical protein
MTSECVLVSHLRATWSATQARIGVSCTALRAYESLFRVRVEASIMHIPFSGGVCGRPMNTQTLFPLIR